MSSTFPVCITGQSVLPNIDYHNINIIEQSYQDIGLISFFI
jgi:hypothetical protein